MLPGAVPKAVDPYRALTGRRYLRPVTPRRLALAGIALLAAVVLAIALRPSSKPPTVAPPTTQPAPPTTTTTTPAPPTSALQITALTPFAVTAAWHTDTPTTDRVSVALAGLPPTLWSAPVGRMTDHRVTVGGLALDSDYTVSVAGHTVAFHTPRPTGSIVASTGGGAILLNGEPFLPLMIWGECPEAYGPAVAAGVDLVADNPCGGAAQQVAALAGSALSAGIAGDSDWQNPSLIGWFYPDEADGRGLTGATLPSLPPSSQVGRIRFLTLTNHFYSRSAPPPQGKAIYPGLVAKADVVGFDLYPLQEWCTSDLTPTYLAQQELVRLASGKPTFQWIEAGPMRCKGRPGTAVTAATVQAESWLALVAGAHGLGFFPGEWTPAIGAAITSVTRVAKAIAPALLAPPVPATATGGVVATARELDGAAYVIAVNPLRRLVQTRISTAVAGSRSFSVLGSARAVGADGGTITDWLGPLAARVYVSSP